MPAIRSAHGVLSLLINCHSVHSISVGRGLQTRRFAGKASDRELELAPQRTPNCSSACTYHDATYTCRARVAWSLEVDREMNVTSALNRVNAECVGQCQCSLQDFPRGQPGCRTAVVGDQCHKAVEWARTHGIRLNHTRYQSLTSGSTFEEFQAYLHKKGLGDCPRPCDLCHTAEPGETCHAAVVQAMGSDDSITFEEMQARLNRTDANSSCPVPCNVCRTAQRGEACFKGVRWAMRHGIHMFPDRYPGLSSKSTFEEFQAALHEKDHERCAMPCFGASTTSMPGTETTSMPASGTNTSSSSLVTTSLMQTSTTMVPVLEREPPIDLVPAS